MREFISEVSVHRNVKMLPTPSGPEATQMWSIQSRKIRFLVHFSIVRTTVGHGEKGWFFRLADFAGDAGCWFLGTFFHSQDNGGTR